MGDGVLAYDERPQHVQIQDLPEGLHIDVLSRCLDRSGAAGGVDQDVDASEPVDRRLYQSLNVAFGEDIGRYHERGTMVELRVQVCGVSLQGVLVPGGQDGIGALAG